jgi:hypothetical protein
MAGIDGAMHGAGKKFEIGPEICIALDQSRPERRGDSQGRVWPREGLCGFNSLSRSKAALTIAM